MARTTSTQQIKATSWCTIEPAIQPVPIVGAMDAKTGTAAQWIAQPTEQAMPATSVRGRAVSDFMVTNSEPWMGDEAGKAMRSQLHMQLDCTRHPWPRSAFAIAMIRKRATFMQKQGMCRRSQRFSW